MIVLVGLSPIVYCYGNNFGLSHNGEVAVSTEVTVKEGSTVVH